MFLTPIFHYLLRIIPIKGKLPQWVGSLCSDDLSLQHIEEMEIIVNNHHLWLSVSHLCLSDPSTAYVEIHLLAIYLFCPVPKEPSHFRSFVTAMSLHMILANCMSVFPMKISILCLCQVVVPYIGDVLCFQNVLTSEVINN